MKIGANCLIASQVGLCGNVTIGDRVQILGQAGVKDWVTVGDCGYTSSSKCQFLIVYNTLYNAMAKLTPSEFLKLKSKSYCGHELKQKFLAEGLCVPTAFDEREIYRLWRIESHKHRDHLSINITTTLKCNACCPYCYEHGVKHVDFDETKINALIEFIRQHKKDKPVKLNCKGYIDGQRAVFKKIFNRITWLAEADIHVDLRLNIDRENMNDILDLIYVLQARFDSNKNVVYYHTFVTGVKDKSVTTRKLISSRKFSFDFYSRVYNFEHLVGRKDKALGTLKRLSEKVNMARRTIARRICERATPLV